MASSLSPNAEATARRDGLRLTEQRRAVLAAEHQTAQLALASEIAGIGYWTHDPGTGVTFHSDELRRLVGQAGDRPPPTASRGAVLAPEHLHPEDRDEHARAWRAAWSS